MDARSAALRARDCAARGSRLSATSIVVILQRPPQRHRARPREGICLRSPSLSPLLRFGYPFAPSPSVSFPP
jgi:hypothetical protein